MEKLKKIDKRLVVVCGLLLFFLIIWFATFSKVNIYKPATQQENERVALENRMAYEKDVDNFNKAILFDTKEFCDLVKNSSMRSNCVKIAPNYNKVNAGVPSTFSADDVDNFNMMLLMNNKSYCNKIINETLMQECISR